MANNNHRRADHEGQHRTTYERNRKTIMKTRNTCGICGQLVDFSLKYPNPMSAVVDHIIPIAKGGHPSDISNLQLAHCWCNRQKSDNLIDLRNRFSATAEVIANNDLPLHMDWSTYEVAGA